MWWSKYCSFLFTFEHGRRPAVEMLVIEGKMVALRIDEAVDSKAIVLLLWTLPLLPQFLQILDLVFIGSQNGWVLSSLCL